MTIDLISTVVFSAVHPATVPYSKAPAHRSGVFFARFFFHWRI